MVWRMSRHNALGMQVPYIRVHAPCSFGHRPDAHRAWISDGSERVRSSPLSGVILGMIHIGPSIGDDCD